MGSRLLSDVKLLAGPFDSTNWHRLESESLARRNDAKERAVSFAQQTCHLSARYPVPACMFQQHARMHGYPPPPILPTPPRNTRFYHAAKHASPHTQIS